MNILINHIGYRTDAAKTMIVEFPSHESPSDGVCAELFDADKRIRLASFEPRSSGCVPGWKAYRFYQFDFSPFRQEGRFFFKVRSESCERESAPFAIGDELLQETTISDILFYFKGQRSSGRWDLADRNAPFYGSREGTVDVHGGWFDAAGDYSKYLSHLSYADYLNPQQIPLVVWALFSLGDTLSEHPRYADSLLQERACEEAWWGADFLMRMKDPSGYFYVTLFDQWSKKNEERMISAFKTKQGERLSGYEAGFRQGGGLAIAALAKAGRCLRDFIPEDGYSPAQFLEAAVNAYEHLKKNNRQYLDNGRENIIDCYCALMAAVELFRSTHKETYLKESREWKERLTSLFNTEKGYWLVEESMERPYFHAAETGLPLIALMHYHEIETDPESRHKTVALLETVVRAELARTEEVYNPFLLARQMVQPSGGEIRSSFFVPHNNETGYWWQGENARLASISCACRMAALLLEKNGTADELLKRMRDHASAQIDWILGLNPFDICMLQGHGRNNPRYEKHYPNAPGGICNGITAGFLDEDDIDFLPSLVEGQGDHRWRWSEQWIPHAAWFLLALAPEMEKAE